MLEGRLRRQKKMNTFEATMHFKKMIGEKCYLSPIDLEDTNLYAEWLNSEEVFQYLLVGTSIVSYESEKEILLRLSKEHVYGIIENENNTLIGNVGLVSVNHIHKTAEVGIFIGRKEYWGKGYGTEALKLLIDYSFRILGIENIMLKVFDYNVRAKKCYEKVGFKVIGERRKAHYYNNERHNDIYMDIIKEDFYKEDKKRSF
jgi:RimJ/RimL family protein N-acetyltransferase